MLFENLANLERVKFWDVYLQLPIISSSFKKTDDNSPQILTELKATRSSSNLPISRNLQQPNENHWLQGIIMMSVDSNSDVIWLDCFFYIAYWCTLTMILSILHTLYDLFLNSFFLEDVNTCIFSLVIHACYEGSDNCRKRYLNR